MVVVMNDDRVNDVEAYLPHAKAFAKDALEHERGLISMEILVDAEVPGRVVYLSHFETKEDFINHTKGETFKKHLPELAPYFISAADTILTVV